MYVYMYESVFLLFLHLVVHTLFNMHSWILEGSNRHHCIGLIIL